MTEITYEGLASPRPLAPDAVRLDGVTKTYGRGAGAVTELRDVTMLKEHAPPFDGSRPSR